MMFELRQDHRLEYSVKTRVILELQKFPATVRELERAGCGSLTSIKRVVKQLEDAGEATRMGREYGKMSSTRYALRKGAGYKFL